MRRRRESRPAEVQIPLRTCNEDSILLRHFPAWTGHDGKESIGIVEGWTGDDPARRGKAGQGISEGETMGKNNSNDTQAID